MSKKLLFLSLCTTVLVGFSSAAFAGTLKELDQAEDWEHAQALISSKVQALEGNKGPKYAKWNSRHQAFLKLQSEKGSTQSFSDAFQSIRNTPLFLTGLSEEEQLRVAMELSLTTHEVEEEKREENRKIIEQQDRAYEESLLVDQAKGYIREYCAHLELQLKDLQEELEKIGQDKNFVTEVRLYKFSNGPLPKDLERQRDLQQRQIILEKEKEELENFLKIKTIEGKWLHPVYAECLQNITDGKGEEKSKAIQKLGQLVNIITEIMVDELKPLRVLKKGEQAKTWPLIHTGNPEFVIEEHEEITVITQTTANAEYLLEGPLYDSVTPGQTLKFSYEITLAPKSKISLSMLNSKRNGWYRPEEVLTNPGDVEQAFTGTLERVVPQGETKASIIFRNYHLGTPGRSEFTIHNLGLEREEAKQGVVSPQTYVQLGSVQLKHLGNSEEVIEGIEGVTVRTPTSAAAEYLLESPRMKVTEGQTVRVSYEITLAPKSKISLSMLNSRRNGWYRPEEVLTNPGDVEQTFTDTLERVVPKEELKTSLVFRNYHLGTPGRSEFTIKDLNVEIVEPPSS